jgi:hypothetical protein
VRIVDEADERSLVGHLRHEAQHGKPKKEPVGRRSRRQAERRAERGALRRRQVLEAVQQWSAELVKPRKGELHLGLHGRRGHDAAP